MHVRESVQGQRHRDFVPSDFLVKRAKVAADYT